MDVFVVGFHPTVFIYGVYTVYLYMGVSVNGGTPISHPKMIIFSRKTSWLLGTTILGNPHMVYI